MSLYDRVKREQKCARLERNKEKNSILKLLLGEISPKGNDSKIPTDESIIELVSSYIKKYKDNIVKMEQAGRDSSEIEIFKHDIAVLQEYLPKQLTEDELTELISGFIESEGLSGMADMKHVMSMLKSDHKDKFDGGLASGIIKRLLTA